jgi:hypothetical protein
LFRVKIHCFCVNLAVSKTIGTRILRCAAAALQAAQPGVRRPNFTYEDAPNCGLYLALRTTPMAQR